MRLIAEISGPAGARPAPAFDNQPRSLNDVVSHAAGRALALSGLGVGLVKRWEGMRQPSVR